MRAAVSAKPSNTGARHVDSLGSAPALRSHLDLKTPTWRRDLAARSAPRPRRAGFSLRRSSRRPSSLVAVVAALSLGLVAACTGKPKAALPSSGPPAPEFVAKTLNHDRISLQDQRGSVVLVNVWATWCGPCREELPVLEGLHRELKNEGLKVLGVSTDVARNRGRVEAMARDYTLSYPILLDPNSDTLRLFKIDGLPTSVLIDRQGAIRWRRTGVIEPNDEEFDAMVRALLAEPPPT